MSIIQSLWIGNKLSIMEELSIISFLKNGHSFHLYVYENIDNIPKGTILKDANKIINKDKIFKYKDFDSYAGFANLFRYKLLLEKGNYWVDMDIICLKPFTFTEDYIFAGFREKKQMFNWKLSVCNCVIKSPKNSELLEYCYTESSKLDSNNLTWGQTGPVLLSKAVKKFNLHSYVAHPNTFCPINWNESQKLINGKGFNKYTKNSFAIHLWNEMWRRAKIDKAGKFSENSIYEILKRRYL